MRKARLTMAIAAATAAMAATGVRAQEVDAWQVAEITGRAEQSVAISQLSRAEVVAELQRAREEGTYFAGNDGPVPQPVIERRMMANQREAERIARAYRDESDRVARMNAPATTTAAAPVSGSDAATAATASSAADPVTTSSPSDPGSSAATASGVTTPSDAAAATATAAIDPAMRDNGSPSGPEVRPNADIATERRSPSDAMPTAEPSRSDATPAAPDTRSLNDSHPAASSDGQQRQPGMTR